MQKLQDSVFSIVKRTSLSPAVFSFLQPSDENPDRTPLGQILSDTKHAWLALGAKFCVIDLKTGLKVAAHNFSSLNGHSQVSISSVVELANPLSSNSQQLIISLQCDDGTGIICVLHVNGSQILRCIQTEVVVTQISVCDAVPDGPFACFDGAVMAGTKNGEIFVFDLNRASLIQALKDISQGYEHLVLGEQNPANLSFLPLSSIHRLEEQRDLAIENEHHIAVLLNENSLVDGQYLFRNPDGSVCMKAKRDQIRVTALQYIPQIGSLAVGFNFGAFQIWNLIIMELEYTSQVNVECLPVTHFGFQEPCDDPRAFCYLWVIFSVLDRLEEEEFPLAVLYSLTYHGKRMLSDTKCLYQDFSMATLRFQVDLESMDDSIPAMGGKCLSCHTYAISSTLGEEGEENMLNICQLVWEIWGENANASPQYGMIIFDLDQWYKDQMPSTCRLESSPFMSANNMGTLACGSALDSRLAPHTVTPYSHCTRLEQHFYPNSLQYECTWLSTSEWSVSRTLGIQRQVLSALACGGPAALLHPTTLYHAARAAGLQPLHTDHTVQADQDEQRRFLLSVCAEARLSRVLRRAARDWATHTHAPAGCTLDLLVDWCWTRAIDLKEYAKELTAPLFVSSALPDRNVVRCLEHCVQQLIQLTGLLDAILTKCCNLVVPDALSEIEEKHKGISTVSLYFQVVQWFLRVGLLPERGDRHTLPYPADQVRSLYDKRRLKLQRLQENGPVDDKINKPCSLLYIDQLIENEFDGEGVREMWLRGGSESYGLYPPPSLYSLLRLYLLPEIAEEHKHSLVLYLLLDYSMIYDEVRYEAVIRRLMQFPTMFGLSNTAIKATQAFWHLDHRDFDFALDQLQCLTGNTLAHWQHSVVLSSLLAQKKMQAALQYLHVRKPVPVQNMRENISAGKLSDWQASCNLYLARQLLGEALDVVRVCAEYSASRDEREKVLICFFKGCRNTGQLSKALQLPLLPPEEEVFIKYLQDCDERQTSDILIMYYLQQARYLEAEQYNNKLKQTKSKQKDLTKSAESLADMIDRDSARDTLVDVVCGYLPTIATAVAKCAFTEREVMPHVAAPKPMSVFVKAKSPKNTFTYKSSFIQDTIENASETWVNKRGIKRALQVDETPFICTPKVARARSMYLEPQPETATPNKRARTTPSATLRALLDAAPEPAPRAPRSASGTPHSILKIKREGGDRDMASPTDSRYLADSDDDLADAASNHTHYSDANKHLRFTIPTASESGSTPSPPLDAVETDIPNTSRASETNIVVDNFSTRTTTPTHPMTEKHDLESPPKKQATEDKIGSKKLKDTVRARRSLSISANSSLSDDPNTSIESIADIPITLINPRFSGERRRSEPMDTDGEKEMKQEDEKDEREKEIPRTPKARRGINTSRASLVTRSRSVTPERLDSPVSPSRAGRSTRSKSRTPERSPQPPALAPIPEQPKLESDSEHHPLKTLLSAPRRLRSRSRTPERVDSVIESPRLEAITESPTKSSSESAQSSPVRRSLRSRSRTPEVEVPVEPPILASPRSLRSRSKTPEKIMSPKKDQSVKSKKSLSRLVLEANAFAKTKANLDKDEATKSDTGMECTPMKTLKQIPSLLDVTLSPIVNKSVLQSSNDSVLSESPEKQTKIDKNITDLGLKTLPAFTTIHETYIEKSVLRSYQSSVGDASAEETKEIEVSREANVTMKSLPAFTTINDEFDKSVLHSYQSSMDESSAQEDKNDNKITKPLSAFTSIMDAEFKPVLGSVESSLAETSREASKCNWKNMSSLMTSDSDIEKDKKEDNSAVIQKEKERIVEIEREIHEIEGDMSDSDNNGESGSDDEEIEEAEEIEAEESDEEEESEKSEEEETSNESVEEVISIKDTDSEESSSSDDKLQINEESSSETNSDNEPKEAIAEVVVERDNKEEEKTDPINQGQLSLLTDDNSEHSNMNLNYSDEKKENVEERQPEVNKIVENPKNEVIEETTNEVRVIYEDSTRGPVETPVSPGCRVFVEEIKTTTLSTESKKVIAEFKDIHEVPPTTTYENIESNKTPERKVKITVTPMDEENIQDNTEATVGEESKNIGKTEVTKLTSNVGEESENSEVTKIPATRPETDPSERPKEEMVGILATEPETVPTELPKEENVAVKPARITRKKSISTKSETEPKERQEIEEPKTPSRRKRAQSTASNKSVEEKTSDSDVTKTRAKTPSSEVRKIITRRASREMSEKIDDSRESMDDSVATPKRRTTRSRSKNVDDNESVASESSIRSTRSRTSEVSDASEVKAAPIRKGRKSILATKPDLSVIPETTVEESVSEKINDYSTSRRLTRTQKAMLESCISPSPSPAPAPAPAPRRGRRASVRSGVSDLSRDDDDQASISSDANTMDRIALLDKEDFEGSPDREELPLAGSPDSLATNAARKPRMARAASESRSTPKAAKISRRVSVDIAATPPPGSPARGRRASFNRACEALHTPKGSRRTSTDSRKGAESPPSPVTPASTRARRPSAASTEQTHTEPGKRSRKASTADESKDTKKK
ncbi:protein ELYS-like [Plodia interpunctella]|uniref:protein ELYS-like n=1 Tax=Plodia interpunctella TaxID=58824 RepID=UPI00236766B1|nr:protein ELYS-like [Plodia interpunctella]